MKKIKTEEEALAAVKRGRPLEHVPGEFRTKEVCLAAVRKDGFALGHIPEEFITEELCLELLRHFPYALGDIPEKFITEELCLSVVKRYPYALGAMPEKFMTEELCLSAVKRYPYALGDIPEKFMTAEVCLEAVKRNHYRLEDVPKNLMTIELCLTAIRQYGSALKIVPDEFKTAELCFEAIRQNGWALNYVPEKYITEELCLEAVRGNGYALQFVPEELKTAQIYLAAVTNKGDMLKEVPKELRTAQIYQAVVSNSAWMFPTIPDEFKTAQICLEAVRYGGYLLADVPEEFKTEEICLAALERDFYYQVLRHVPMEYRTAKVCLESVKRDGKVLQYVPDELKTAEICIEAMAGGGKVFWHIPETRQTGELDLESLKGKNLLLRDLLEKSLGGQKAGDLISRLLSKFWRLPYDYNLHMDPPPIVGFVRREQAQTIAIILACFDPKKALDILQNLPCDTQADVVRRIATMNISSPKAFPPLVRWMFDNRILEKREETPSGISLVKILDLAKLATGKEIIETLESKDPELVKELYSRIFLFEFDKVHLLSDRDIQKIMREVDKPVLAKALKGVETSVRDRIFDNMSTQVAKELGQDMERMGAIGLEDINKAQQNIVSLIRYLENTGEIVISRPDPYDPKEIFLRRSGDGLTSVGGMESLVGIFALADRGMERLIIKALEDEDPMLAKQLKKRKFMFEDIARLEDKQVQELIRKSGGSHALAKAVMHADAKVREKIFANMSKPALSMLMDNMEYMGLVSLKDVDKAQQEIVSIVRQTYS